MQNVSQLKYFQNIITKNPKVAVHFWAKWCEPCGLLDSVLEQLGKDAPSVACVRVEAEECPEISEQCNVSVVPLFLFYKDGAEVDRLEGAEPAELTAKFLKLANASGGAAPLPSLKNDAAAASAQVGTGGGLAHRLRSLVNQQPVMLFMKGNPEEPRCGFSRKVVEAIQETGTQFGTFDILNDDEVRQGLKEFSNWPTYPQLYVNGELLGGCDIILELAEAGELKQELAEASTSANGGNGGKNNNGVMEDPKAALRQRLDALVRSKPVMLFMKGNPEEPRCGFSRKVVDALRAAETDFGSFDILTDEDVRQGLKELSNWPTYPQVYVHGGLLGGCDIVLDLAEAGELKDAIDELRPK